MPKTPKTRSAAAARRRRPRPKRCGICSKRSAKGSTKCRRHLRLVRRYDAESRQRALERELIESATEGEIDLVARKLAGAKPLSRFPKLDKSA